MQGIVGRQLLARLMQRRHVPSGMPLAAGRAVGLCHTSALRSAGAPAHELQRA